MSFMCVHEILGPQPNVQFIQMSSFSSVLNGRFPCIYVRICMHVTMCYSVIIYDCVESGVYILCMCLHIRHTTY